jgi:hypothetical protein
VAVATAVGRGEGLELGRTTFSYASGDRGTEVIELNARARRMLRRGPLRYKVTLRLAG